LDVNETVAKNVVYFRNLLGLSQNKLAEKLGVSPQAISKWERGICCPDISLLPALSRVFEVSIDELFKKR